MSDQTLDTAPDSCSRCARPPAICVCDRIVELKTKRRVVILQHPREQDVVLGSAGLVAQSLTKAKVIVGLSWGTLAHALGQAHAEPSRWAVLFPHLPKEAPKALQNQSEPGSVVVVNRHGKPHPARRLDGIVVLDGSWSQAKTLWWRNPWLTKLCRMRVVPKEPSIYGALRHEPKREYVSTLEAVGAALSACGEDPEVEAQLKRVFRTLAQRARDEKAASRKAPVSRRPRPSN